MGFEPAINHRLGETTSTQERSL